MSTFCDTAAPTRHPPGEAHAAPRALPLTTWLAQVAAPSGYRGGAAARGMTTTSPIEEPLSPLSSHDNTTGDISTPTRSTTSVFCRQKRIRRHSTALGVIYRLWEESPTPMPFTTPCHSGPIKPFLGSEPPPTVFATSKPKKPLSPCRLMNTRHTTPQLQLAQQLRPAVAQNASGDTKRHATKKTDVLPAPPASSSVNPTISMQSLRPA